MYLNQQRNLKRIVEDYKVLVKLEVVYLIPNLLSLLKLLSQFLLWFLLKKIMNCQNKAQDCLVLPTKQI